MVQLKDIKVGKKIAREELGNIGEMMEEDPEVIAISYEIYDRKGGMSTELKLKVKDYDKIQEELA